MSTTPAALKELRDAYDDRPAAIRRRRAAGAPVVGCVGADVPVELVTAAGALPVRLAGDPARDRDAADRYLGTGLDPAAGSILAGLLSGEPELDLLLISNDCAASLRLFYTVRELRRLGVEPALPRTHLVDVLHLPHRTTTRYNRVRLAETKELLERWSGRRIGESELAKAVRQHDEARRRMLALRRLRTADRPALRGEDALIAIGAGAVLTPEEHTALLDRLMLADADLPRYDRPRLYLTGSAHDGPEVYRAIEDAGYLIVADDHDWGDALAGPLVGEPTLDALAERYQYRAPTAARSSVRVRADQTAATVERSHPDLLVCYVRDRDEAPAWDFPAQRRAAGVPAVILEHRRYGELGEDALPIIADALRTARQNGETG
ncbi:2-hydroxyacyl-CoA dehydratase family protein [Actinoallomurus sp. NBC_01490]|uniref:2-hydroxyacyl-CoA dehydratase family protein n=1 Tax=Actinoallomurus sp. NBC_01490 TaxID=2903557 RepID=UPI002E316525|nr:2-hydroxyacyl-CoA dehydratase family protein [Actinoallomurus sp. NBC_01490]